MVLILVITASNNILLRIKKKIFNMQSHKKSEGRPQKLEDIDASESNLRWYGQILIHHRPKIRSLITNKKIENTNIYRGRKKMRSLVTTASKIGEPSLQQKI
ncbi:hypothetical protein HS088_TW21G00318 [Tripterygium wilfordii]|uniref:Uncharacterized protein n=1 Tax=Tripterygium wilfordii TaxID=458696 RepID=A0A7J7C2L8_TRIWF|nr:hypothetical protein HS088_TW21G00318 [Tripterygium wilfordii]